MPDPPPQPRPLAAPARLPEGQERPRSALGATPRTAPAPARPPCATWRRRERLVLSVLRRCPASAMRNLRLLRAGGCRSAAATGTPQCFCLSAEPGAVLVCSQYGLVELRPAGDSVRAAAAGQGLVLAGALGSALVAKLN